MRTTPTTKLGSSYNCTEISCEERVGVIQRCTQVVQDQGKIYMHTQSDETLYEANMIIEHNKILQSVLSEYKTFKSESTDNRIQFHSHHGIYVFSS